MNLEEFESQYRVSLEASLNELQSVILLLAKLQVIIVSIEQNIHNLAASFEEYTQQQKDR